MNAFAALLDRLSTTAGRKDKLALIQNWLATTPDPDRGYGLAALTGDLSFRHAKAGVLRSLITERSDPTLFALSYDYVGDLAETVALLWPSPPTPQTANTAPSLSNVVERLQTAGRTEVPGLVSAWLDSLDEDGRWALLKLLTGGLRVGVSARLARLAFADWAGKPIEQVEEAWHGHAPPYDALFAWAMGTGPAPDSTGSPAFRPFMLAHPMEPGDQEALDPKDCLIEWKWDGIRAQLADASGGIKLFSRTGDDLCAAFPDLVEALRGIDATVDGELLVRRAHPLDETDDGAMPASFNALQQRLNRKTVPAKMLRDSPALLRVYDLLIEAGEDLRPLPLSERRKRLEVFVAQNQDRAPWLDLSEPVSLPDW
ncbi:MAG: cisplatin damage response ATP-dependent DNA ligase, partial [Rhodospirillaceae bacterium]